MFSLGASTKWDGPVNARIPGDNAQPRTNDIVDDSVPLPALTPEWHAGQTTHPQFISILTAVAAVAVRVEDAVRTSSVDSRQLIGLSVRTLLCLRYFCLTLRNSGLFSLRRISIYVLQHWKFGLKSADFSWNICEKQYAYSSEVM